MSVQNDHQVSQSQAEDAWTDYGSDFVLIAEGKPPTRIELARERMLICRLYLGLLRTITDDYGAEFAVHSDSLAYRTIGIYVFLRTLMCSPVRASQIAHALKLPRVAVLRRLQEMVKHGYVERVGNAYRVADKVNIPELQNKLQRRIDMSRRLRRDWLSWALGLGRPAAILQRPSTEQAVFHKPTWPDPSDRPSPPRLRKTGFKASCAVEFIADPVQSLRQ